jgi:hypothetical protein
MDQELSLAATFNLALKLLEVAALQARPDFDPKSFLERLRYWTKVLQEIDESDEQRTMDRVEEVFLDGKGIVVVGRVSVHHLRTILQERRLERMLQYVDDESMLDVLVSALELEWGPIMRGIERKIEEEAASKVEHFVRFEHPEWTEP